MGNESLYGTTTLEQVTLGMVGGAHEGTALDVAKAFVQGYLSKLGKAVWMHILQIGRAHV